MPQHPDFSTRQSRLSSMLWQGTAVALVIIGAPLPYFSTPLILIANLLVGDPAPASQSFWLQAMIFVPTLTIAGYCQDRARRHRAVPAYKLLRHDQRSPVVYCRSFWDEFEDERSWRRVLYHSWRAARGFATEEQQVAEVASELGPFIALGAPEDRLPELGASRMYVGSDWQEKFLTLVKRARLVILRPGNTPGFWWELETVIKARPPEGMLFLLPFDKNQYADFCKKLKPHIPSELPDYPDRIPRTTALKSCLYFDPDWTPHIMSLDMRNVRKNPHKPLVANLKAATEPLIQHLGLKWKKPPRYGLWGLQILDMLLAIPLVAGILFIIYGFLWYTIRMSDLLPLELLLFVVVCACAVWFLLRKVTVFFRDG
ncbi:MAG TPA: hypothetical protein VG649_06470 [Candidatus Angelobacter sp.]|jgi:hypothetical protein|nr:hypothetical protein [Candidatus Angelobacter sp.]